MMTILLTFFTLIMLTPIFFFLTECFGAALAHKTKPARGNSFSGSASIIVPAHNEGEAIVPTLNNLLEHRPANTRILVVADNCTDDTAALSREAMNGHHGCTVVERTDTTARGKGYALEFGLNALREQPPDIVIFIDADCLLRAGSLNRLIERAHETGRPAQALYLMERSVDSAPSQGVAAFAWMVMNRVRMSGLYRLFDVTRLTGSGMAFSWPLLRDHFEGTSNIVEDLGLTISLLRLGYPPILVDDAVVTSKFPDQNDATTTQRARWELGSIAMLRQHVFPLLRDAIARADLRMIAMGLDLAIPPLVIMIAGTVLLMAVLFIPALFGISFPLIVTMVSLILLFVSLFAVWIYHGRRLLALREVGGIVVFLAQKLRIYGRAGRDSAKTWTRTERD